MKMSKKKSKPCSYYSGVEPWKNKRQQKEEIDRKKEMEVFESLNLTDLGDALEDVVDDFRTSLDSFFEMVAEMVKNMKEE